MSPNRERQKQGEKIQSDHESQVLGEHTGVGLILTSARSLRRSEPRGRVKTN